MKKIIESRLVNINQTKTVDLNDQLFIEDKIVEDKIDPTQNVCQKCFTYQPIVNNIYCIACLQCEKCFTLLSIKDDECPHCSKVTNLPSTVIKYYEPVHIWKSNCEIKFNPYVDGDVAVSKWQYKNHFPEKESQNSFHFPKKRSQQMKHYGYRLAYGICNNRVPKCILRYIMMKFLDINTIKKVVSTVSAMNVLDNFCVNMLDHAMKGFIWNCENGYLDIAKWLYSRYDHEFKCDINKAFILSCANGHLDVVQWLHSHVNVNNKNKAFNISCKNGYLDIAQWLYLCDNVSVNDRNVAFRMSCANGHINLVQWLYSLGGIDLPSLKRRSEASEKIGFSRFSEDFNADCMDEPFKLACKNGHITVAKWLHSLGGVNIHADNEYAFRTSCENGHIDVAQWLHSLGGVNIYADNEYAFRTSCENGYTDLAQWLCSLDK